MNKYTSTYIKQKLLEEGLGLNLTRTLEIAAKCEKVETNWLHFQSKGKNQRSINKINERANNSSTSRQGRFHGGDKICYRCSLMRHFSRDPQCPSRGKTCRKCRGKDHFEKVCKTKTYARQVGREPDDNDPGPSMTMHSVLQREKTQKWSLYK